MKNNDLPNISTSAPLKLDLLLNERAFDGYSVIQARIQGVPTLGKGNRARRKARLIAAQLKPTNSADRCPFQFFRVNRYAITGL